MPEFRLKRKVNIINFVKTERKVSTRDFFERNSRHQSLLIYKKEKFFFRSRCFFAKKTTQNANGAGIPAPFAFMTLSVAVFYFLFSLILSSTSVYPSLPYERHLPTRLMVAVLAPVSFDIS